MFQMLSLLTLCEMEMERKKIGKFSFLRITAIGGLPVAIKARCNEMNPSFAIHRRIQSDLKINISKKKPKKTEAGIKNINFFENR